MSNTLESSWVVGVNEYETPGREAVFMKGLEELEAAIQKKKSEVEDFKPEFAMIGMDKEGRPIESYPEDIDIAGDEVSTEEASEATDDGLVLGELDDSTSGVQMTS
jgi:hypothetical protein